MNGSPQNDSTTSATSVVGLFFVLYTRIRSALTPRSPFVRVTRLATYTVSRLFTTFSNIVSFVPVIVVFHGERTFFVYFIIHLKERVQNNLFVVKRRKTTLINERKINKHL